LRADANSVTVPGSTTDDGDRSADVFLWLKQCAAAPLPGREAQRRFEPPWGFGRHYGPPSYDAVPAAVALLLYPHAGRLMVPLTLRQVEMTSHAGQISLPGGRIEAGESDVDAAFRELHEELGVAPETLTPLAPLSPLYIFGTNFLVQPWLAWTPRRPEFVVSPTEVAALLEVPWSHFHDAANCGCDRRTTRGVSHETPCFVWEEHRIWGATAMILAEAAALVADKLITEKTIADSSLIAEESP